MSESRVFAPSLALVTLDSPFPLLLTSFSRLLQSFTLCPFLVLTDSVCRPKDPSLTAHLEREKSRVPLVVRGLVAFEGVIW